MKRIRKGFTLVEAVVTISIMSIVFALSAIVIANLITIQNKSADKTAENAEADKVESFISDYVSFVSIKTDSLSFSYYQSSDHDVSFKSNGYTYTLAYSDNQLSVLNNYDGLNEYLQYEKTVTLKNTKSITFDYSSSLSLLKVESKIGNHSYDFACVFKV